MNTLARDDFEVAELQDARDETRAAIALHAVTLIDLVLARSVDPVVCEVATAMRELLAREHRLVAAIRAQVG